MIDRRTALPLLASPLLLTGCGGSGGEAGHRTRPTRPAPATGTTSQAEQSPRGIPGLGPTRTAAIPEQCTQAVVATGRGPNSPRCTVVLYQRTADGWQPGPSWPAHNALHGWSSHHMLGDLRSPLGVYTLSDAGGLLPDPGSRLPYHESSGFRSPGTGFEGEPLEGCFDYVIAIDYNRRPGTSPLDWTRPLGPKRGGGVWLHVDHGGPTHGCVSVAKAHMKDLLRTLDPARHPVVAMGYADWLAV
ncbi:L,D-transpeptidase family protein [Streptomyces griseofuscus]|uniref:Lipoprotein n=1 Tax=Streptomyces griseofuscus TaxID=146922 RepID=A0A7H1QAG7_9ACTN|nr:MULTISPECIES: L,D-transpeptidase family protein [Streptomyces]MBA9044017.1 L,D-peptidoglycan transpeptidase YkuD (ErfK/YbiS/YcfS/YnhG family) [Streptomyces murinus]QNT97297.1 lipoprotein [Streptomyces griseofuscus]BBC97898.1 transpeptidase [Streptomyces rochei]